MLSTIGKLLVNLSLEFGSFWSSFIAMGVFVKIISFTFTNKYFKSACLTKYLDPYIDEIKKKHEKNPDKRNELITKMLMQNNYSIFGSISANISPILIGILFFFLLKDADKYIFSVPQAQMFSRGFLVLEDLSKPITSMGGAGFDSIILLTMGIAVLPILVSMVTDKIMMDKLVISQNYVYYALWFVYFVADLYIGSGFVLFLFTYKLCDLLCLIYYMKFYKVKKVVDHRFKVVYINDLQNTKEKDGHEEEDDKKAENNVSE